MKALSLCFLFTQCPCLASILKYAHDVSLVDLDACMFCQLAVGLNSLAYSGHGKSSVDDAFANSVFKNNEFEIVKPRYAKNINDIKQIGRKSNV